MAGEHLLELLDEPNARLTIGDKWLIREVVFDSIKFFTVYQRKANQKYARILIQTTGELEACRVMMEH